MKKRILSIVFGAVFLCASFGLTACDNEAENKSKENLMAIKPDGWTRIVEDSPYYLGEKVIKEHTYEDGSSYLYYSQDYGNYPCIDGSTALMPIAWEAFWQFLPDSSIYHPYTAYPNADVMAEALSSFSTTHEAYLNLIDKKPIVREIVNLEDEIVKTEFIKAPDIVLASSPSQSELDYAAEKGVELIINAVGYDAFVFITHKDNPVDSLTIQQVKDIYSGKITNWKQVGGKNKKITAYQRAANSGSQTGMEQLVMKDTQLMTAPKKQTISMMDGLINAVADYKNDASAIGYTYKYYMNNLFTNEDIKIIKIDGIEASDQNIVSRTYPFVAKGNAVVRKDELDGVGGTFMSWLMSEEGQMCVAQAGYVPAYL